MAISVLSVCMAFGAVVGTSEGIQASQRRARREEHRSRKNNLVIHCPKSSAYSPILQGRRVVLSANNCFIDTGDGDESTPFGHPFAGYYLPYPEAGHAGLVSTITDVAPIMNWVFVDRTTYALCYGARAASEGQLTGPWDCTRQDRRMTLCGWEGFVAVRFPPEIPGLGGLWVLFFDCDGDRLQARLAAMPPGTVSVEVQLQRRELKTERPIPLAELEKMEQERLQREKEDMERIEREKQGGEGGGGGGEGQGEENQEQEQEQKQDTEHDQEGRKELTAEQVAELQRMLEEEERLKAAASEEPGEAVSAEQTTPAEDPKITPQGNKEGGDDDGRGRKHSMAASARTPSESPHQSIKSASSRTTQSHESRSSSSLDRADTDTDDGYTSSVSSNFFNDHS